MRCTQRCVRSLAVICVTGPVLCAAVGGSCSPAHLLSAAQPAWSPAPSADSLEAENRLPHVAATPRTVGCAPSLRDLTLTGICEGGGAPQCSPHSALPRELMKCEGLDVGEQLSPADSRALPSTLPACET